MLDYSLIYFIMLFAFWIYLIDLTIEKKELIAIKYLQFVFMIPLNILLAHNSYVQAFPFGYIICFVIGILSLYVMISDYIN